MLEMPSIPRAFKTVSIDLSNISFGASSISSPFSEMPSCSSISFHWSHEKRIADIDAIIRQNDQIVDRNEVYYVISLSWWNEWRCFSPTLYHPHFINKINNWPLVDGNHHDYESTHLYHIRKGRLISKDFLILPKVAWIALYSWYGGGPSLPRMYSLTNFDILQIPMMNAESRLSSDTLTLPTCFCCLDIAVNRCDNCLSVYYCSKRCQTAHWKFHMPYCKYGSNNPSVLRTNYGRTGLVNLGNSCYMNVALQCLSHISTFTFFCISDKYLSIVNRTNKDGTAGSLIKEYSDLLKNLWFGSDIAVNPINFKKVFSKINADYAGFLQHDVHEFYEYLIDKIHEDLNQVQEKPYVEFPEGNGTNDEEIAQLTWELHSKRHDSIIKDTLGGQLRSQLVCPVCQKISVKFDPFTALHLPVPLETDLYVKILFVFGNDIRSEYSSPILCRIKVKRSTSIKNLKFELCIFLRKYFILKPKPSELLLFDVDPDTRLPISELSESNGRVEDIINGLTIVYFKPLGHDFVFVFNRLILYDDEEIKCKTTGYPILVSFDNDWSIEKFRQSLLSQLPVTKSALEDGFTAEGLSIRFVDENCMGVDFNGCNEDSREENELDTHIVGMLGKRFPSHGYTMKEFVSINLALDIAVGKKSFLDIDEVNTCREILSDEKLDISHIHPRPTRARTESEIPISLENCFREFSKEEVLSESESWYCSNCKDHRQAKKTVNLWRLPKVLILNLKRYKQGAVFCGEAFYPQKKIDNFVDFSLDGLNLRKYLSPRNPLHSSEFEDECTYDLFAVCNHYGRMGFGHYTALARRWTGSGLSPDWFSYDDDVVSKCSSVNEVKSNAAYVLFYRKRELCDT